MSRRTSQIALSSMLALLVVAVLAAPTLAGDCHGVYGSCHTLYAPTYAAPVYAAPICSDPYACGPRDIYLLMKSRPDLIKRFPGVFSELERRFAEPVAPAAPAEVAPAAPAEAAPAVPAPAAGEIREETTIGPAETEISTPAPAAVAAPVAGDALNASEAPAAVAAPPAEAAPAVPAELQPLLGLWQNVSPSANGGESLTSINLEADGNATLTVDAAGIGPVTVKRPFAISDGQFRLTGDQELVLGKVISANKDQVILERDGVQLAFTRP